MAVKTESPENFWREYEEKTGEKVLARGMGQYISGWDEFGNTPKIPLWGLIIATSGGFRFHHFPQTNWFSLLTQSGDTPPKEKTIFIPSSNIISAVLRKETTWYKKIFFPIFPRLQIRYHDEDGTEKELVFSADHKSDGVAFALGARA